MSAVTILTNKHGDKVEVPEEIAKELFGQLKAVDYVLKVAQTNDADDVEDAEAVEKSAGVDEEAGGAPEERVRLDSLDCPRAVLEVIQAYAMLPSGQRTTNLRKPLSHSIEVLISKEEMAMLQKAAEQKYLTPLLETSLFIGFTSLADLCAAFAYQRIEAIAKEAPNIMDGAESIRQFLNIDNEWTAEEMEHLRKEMEFAKTLDPRAY